MSFAIPFGLTATLLACLCLYAASSHQRLWRHSWPRWPARGAAILLAGLGWLALVQQLQYLAAAFVWCSMVMLILTLLPYLGAWCHVRRSS